MAQKPMQKQSFEISLEDDEKIITEIKNNMRIDVNTGLPVALYAVNFDVPQGTPEEMAQYYLQHESKKLGIPTNEIANLYHHATRTTNAGSVIRYRQHLGSYPVNKAEVTISISPQNQVVFVMNSYQVISNMNGVQPSVSDERAYQLAFDYLNVQSDVMYRANRVMIYNNTKMTRLAYEVTILTNSPAGEWHVFVDARTQEIFKVVDMASYYCDSNKDEHDENCTHDDTTEERSFYTVVDGTGMVFNPDPLSSNTVAYGGQYVDGNDATNASLDAARFNITLSNIEELGGVYKLKGPLAEIVDFDAPNTGLFTQNSSVFNFNRQDQAFEAVNCYYHINFMMDYINNTLGLNIMPYQYSGGVKFDPHGANGADQSYYTGGSGQLSFGEGCVDDGEDSDVIHHELGHGLHDWVTAGGGSGAEGLGEGSGDYVAQSYNRSLGNWNSGDAAYNWVFNWDGHNVCWQGRVTNYGASYPGGLVGQIHTDGQIWSTCLMGIWDQIGQQEMDTIFWEGLGMTAGTTGQNDAAVAVYQASINLGYTQAQITTIHTSLTACGYTLPTLPFGDPIAAFSADSTSICLDDTNTVNFTDDSAPLATSWSWTFEGGTPATSSAQNPTVTYTAEGTYDVTLVATNADGSDTLVETDYITISQGASCVSCSTYASAQSLGIAIPDGTGAFTPGASVNHGITIPLLDDKIIDYITVNTDFTHTFIRDLEITITHPNGSTAVIVWDQECEGENNLDVTFEDGAAAIVCAEPTVGTYNPTNALSAFSGLNSVGDWTISVRDWYVGDTGNLNDWSIEVCGTPVLSVEENNFDEFAIFPNPNHGEFTITLSSASNNDVNVMVYDIRGRQVFDNAFESSSSFNQTINLGHIQSGMYLVKISDGERETIRKIIVE